jgi:hypothetical protein
MPLIKPRDASILILMDAYMDAELKGSCMTIFGSGFLVE